VVLEHQIRPTQSQELSSPHTHQLLVA
jgi:hypothetical protein